MAPPTHPRTIADATWTCVTSPLCLQGFGVTAVLRQAWSAVGSLTERLADVAYDYVPDSVSRPTVCSSPLRCLRRAHHASMLYKARKSHALWSSFQIGCLLGTLAYGLEVARPNLYGCAPYTSCLYALA